MDKDAIKTANQVVAIALAIMAAIALVTWAIVLLVQNFGPIVLIGVILLVGLGGLWVLVYKDVVKINSYKNS